MLRPLLNATYWMLADSTDEKGRKHLDRTLEGPLDPPVRSGRPSVGPGASELLRMMRGGG